MPSTKRLPLAHVIGVCIRIERMRTFVIRRQVYSTAANRINIAFVKSTAYALFLPLTAVIGTF